MAHIREIVAREGARRWATIAVVAAILLVTLRPVGTETGTAFKWCIGCSELGTLDLLYNIALFVPLGVLLGLRGVSALQTFGLATVLSVCIELLQLTVVPGRDPTLSDIIANSLGGALGVPLARLPAFFARATSRQWQVVAWAWVALSLAAIAFGAWAVTVPIPVSEYYVQWLPQRVGYARFGGDVRAFQVNGLSLAPAALIPARQFPDEFFDLGPDASVRLTPGPRNSRTAMIARLALEYGEFLMLGSRDDALVVRYRARAPQVGLRSPILALDGAFAGDPLAVVEVRAIKRYEHVELRATKLGVARPYALRHDRVTAARLWTTLLPFERGFGSLGIVGDVLWMALLAAPAAYVGVRSYGRAARILPSAAQAAGVAIFAGSVEPSLFWWPVWLGIAAGALAGSWLGRAYRRGRA